MQPVPMDRIICGDVGYGKTEIAVRAAFKAVQDGKQVAVLVPTTLLANQHFKTFSERFAQFPVTVAVLSRFQSKTESRRDRRASSAAGRDRRPRRHPPAAAADHPVQGPRPGHRRRGAALRRRAQGVPEEHADGGRRPVDVGDADPAHAGDVADRHPRDVDDPHPARGAAPGADLRRRVGGQADGRRDPPRAAARRPGLRDPQPGAVDRQGGGEDPQPGARGAGRGRPRADEGARARADHGRLLGEGVRRPGRDDDRRVRAWTSRTPTP